MKLNWVRFNQCKTCGTMFVTEAEDIAFYFNPDTGDVKRYVMCPECFARILVEVKEEKRMLDLILIDKDKNITCTKVKSDTIAFLEIDLGKVKRCKNLKELDKEVRYYLKTMGEDKNG